MTAALKRWWWRVTHQNRAIVYDPPRRIPGARYTISGMMITSERRWYQVTHRILWGHRPTQMSWWTP